MNRIFPLQEHCIDVIMGYSVAGMYIVAIDGPR